MTPQPSASHCESSPELNLYITCNNYKEDPPTHTFYREATQDPEKLQVLEKAWAVEDEIWVQIFILALLQISVAFSEIRRERFYVPPGNMDNKIRILGTRCSRTFCFPPFLTTDCEQNCFLNYLRKWRFGVLK